MKKLLSCILCVAVILSVSAAETVAKFASLEAGAKSLGYTVAAHESGGGFCVTGGKSWNITDGVTVVLKYSGLPATGNQAIVTLAQSNDANKLSKVGIGVSDGVLKGVLEGSLWTGGETTGKTLPERGTIVFVYYPDQSTRGIFTYDADGTELFKAKGLKSTGSTVPLGAQFDFAANHAGSLSTEGFVIEAVEILKGAVASNEVAAVLANFEKTSAAQAFVSQVGTSASGWFSDWSGEKNGGECKIVGTNGTVLTARRINGSVSYHPYISSSSFAAKDKVLLSFYGTTDFMPTPAAGKLAVLWNFGRSGNCNALALDENRHLVFVHSAGTTVSKRIDAGEVPKGYHLYTVVFDKDKGCGVYIDNNAGVFDATFTSVSGGGWQVGSIYGGTDGLGTNNPYVKGDGFVPLTIWASEDAFIPMIDLLAKMYPAVTTINADICFETNGGKLYLPSLTNTVGNLFQMKRGTLIVPAAVEATLDNIEFGDKDDNPTCGLELDGVLNIVKSSTGACTDAGVYRQNNANNGVLFGEWTGTGTYTIRGTFNAPNAYVDLVHDAGAQTFVVNGGTFAVKGVTAKKAGAVIELKNGGTLDLGSNPSMQNIAIVKNYDSGTVTTTGVEYDTLNVTDDVTLNFANNGKGLRGTLNVAEGATCALRGGNDLLSYNSGDCHINVKGTLDLGTTRQTTFASTHITLFNGGTLSGTGGVSEGTTVALDTCAADVGVTIAKDETVESPVVTIAAPIGSHKNDNNTNHLAVAEGASDVIVSIPDAAVLSGYYNWQIDEGVNVMFGEQKTIAATRALIVNGNLVVSNGTEIAAATTLVTANGGVTLGETAKLTDEDGAELACVNLVVSEDGKSVLAVPGAEVIRVDGVAYASVDVALKHLTVGSSVEISDAEKVTFADGVFTQDGVTYDPLAYNGFKVVVDEETGAMTAALAMAEGAALRFSEIMPKPVDKPVSAQYPATLERMDVNGLESGWVELENTSDKWVDLADYRFIRVNRSKKTDTAAYGNLASRLVAPHARTVFYTSERYPNGDKKGEGASAFVKGIHDSFTTEIYDDPETYGVDLHGVMVWPDKINPKKFPYVRLYYAPAGTDVLETVDTVVIPSDIPEGHSIVVGEASDDEATQRWMTDCPTRGTANTTTGLVALGPNVGPLYEKKGQKKTDIVSEFDVPVAPAQTNADYAITLAVNPVMNPDGTFKPRAKDVITRIRLVYRTDLDDATLATNEVEMASVSTDANWGNRYTTVIPKEALPEAGHLIQWKTILTDAAGNEWTSPSFNNPDDGYEWYGTIVESEELTSKSLPTWHMFVDNASKAQMDIDADKQNLNVVPHNARVAIYDSSTSNYYDYVRIDLRGNTSAKFKKKSHGLRFAKAHPLTMWDPVAGETREEVRKSSLIGEPADPSRMRQMMAFWLWNKMGNKVPFDFPVRCNLNGAFYQLGFHSERFTDELIEDFHNLDKYGYGYKNVGTLASDSGTTAGSIEKKTPDDGNESDVSVLENELRRPLKDRGIDTLNASNNVELPAVTKFVVEKFDLPAWLNYLASARITQEMDDVWANISIYYDNAAMKEGVRGTGTWMPLGYDFNLTFGQWYINDVQGATRDGTYMSNQDWFKSHPLYGGKVIRCYKQETMTTMCNEGNRGIEAVWQSPKFRRLYLRRLRTLMDQELGAPKADETLENTTVPVMVRMKEIADLMRADANEDTKTYPWDSSIGNIDIWGSDLFPKTMDAGIAEIWTKYIVPRREHLYVTHSITNTAKEVGYGTQFNAGIPLAQSSVLSLRDKITTVYDAAKGAVVIRNANAETVDLSGWTLEGPVAMTLPAGTVLDEGTDAAPGEVTVVVDRRAYVAALGDAIVDQVIVGNASVGKSETITLTAADEKKTKVIFTPTPEYYSLRLHSFDGVTPVAEGDSAEWIVLTNVSATATLNLKDVRIRVLKDGAPEDQAKLDVTLTGGTLEPGASVKLEQAALAEVGWSKITNNKIHIAIWDANASQVQSAFVTQKIYTNYYGDAGNKTAPIGGKFYLVATSFGETLAQADFDEVAYPSPTWEETEVTDETPLAELVPEVQAQTLKKLNASPVALAKWAKAHHAADTLGAAIDLEAFALDCATAEVDEKKKAFKVTISFDPVTGKPVVTKAEGVSLNVEPTIEGSTDLIDWHDKADGDRFFKAVIRLGE